MEIIFVSKRRGRLGRAPLRWPGVLAVLLAVAGAGAILVYGGYRLGADLMVERLLRDPDGASELWQRELVAQRRMIEQARTRTEQHLNALALRVGKLRAHVARLNALGARVAERADLDESELDFAAEPALGGPQPSDAPDPADLEGLVGDVEALFVTLEDREDKLEAMETLLRNRQLEGRTYPAGRPIRSGWMSSGFGYRTDPMSGKKEFHRGVDFAGRRGSEVLAVAAGVVTRAERHHGHGNMIELNHGNGYVTRYSHNEENLVGVGARLDKDEIIARMGSTGRSTGPHVHFEVFRDGKIVNPAKFVRSARR